MHEFSLVEQVLGAAIEVAEENGGRPIARIELEIGALQQVVPDALAFAFEAAKAGTPAENAALAWTEVPAEVRCPACAHIYAPDDVFWVCPKCNAPGGKAVSGDDLILSKVVLEEP
ncbi:MAG: hydrogenase maturation nickel metallochaperone HypA [Candidatus Hydrogenedentota bacterium]